jgi:hypothetical protein
MALSPGRDFQEKWALLADETGGISSGYRVLQDLKA